MEVAGYTKLFSSILMSSIWEESTETRLVWVTLLALADQNGHVDGTVKSLARVSRVSLEECQKALDCLLGPDPLDRSGVAEGRRIVPEQGGWRLVNHAAYRAKMSADERRERDKLRKREARMSVVSAGCPQPSEFVRDVSQAEAEAEAEQKQEEQKPPDALRARFDRWWASYPSKQRIGKGAALKIWNRLRPSEQLTDAMVGAVNRQRQSAQWKKDGGAFIPHARTWLSQGRWEDGGETDAPPVASERDHPLYRQYEAWQQQTGPDAARITFEQFRHYAESKRAS